MMRLLRLVRFNRYITAVAAALFVYLVVPAPWLAGADSTPLRPNFTQDKITLQGSDGTTRTLRVELARTEEEVSYGLMYLSDLPGTDGMLFRLPNLAQYAFWMKNTIMPLDIVYFDDKGAVVNLYANAKPLSMEHLYSSGPARMVLEVKAGMAKEWAIGPGATIIPPAGFLP